MHFAGGLADIESFAAWVYFPALIALLGLMGNAQILLLGIGITFGMWFAIGCATGLVIDRLVPRHRFVATLIFFLVVIVAIVILPILPQRGEYQRRTGAGYSLEECRNISASLNNGTDRSSCIRTVAVQMINEEDPAVNEQFCNDLFTDADSESAYCWSMLAIRKGASADFCSQITDEASRNGCLSTMARKLKDPSICQLLRGDRGGTPELCVKAMKW